MLNVNNLPEYAKTKSYIVATAMDDGELWFWGADDSKVKADTAVAEAPNRVLIVNKNSNDNIPTVSVSDILEAYRNYDASPEIADVLLCFMSELTGLSVDTLTERLAV